MKTIYLLAGLLAGCGVEPTSSGHGVLVTEQIYKHFDIAAPVPVSVFVATRSVDYAGASVEYEIEIDDRPLSVSYWITAQDAKPLHTAIYDRRSGARMDLAANDQTMEASLAGAMALRVEDYLQLDATRSEVLAAVELDAVMLRAATAALVVRPEVGIVPDAFFNRQPRIETDDGVVAGGSETTPLLAGWRAPTSLLGAFLIQGACIDRFAKAQPCCVAYESAQTGKIEGGCAFSVR